MALTDKQITVLNLLIYENKLKKEAAEAVGVLPQTISNWFNNSEFLKTFEEMRGKLLQEASYKALQQMINLAHNAESDSVKFQAAKDLLSRAGMDAVNRQEITQRTIVVGVEDGTEDNTETGDIQLEIPTLFDELPK